MRNLPHHITQAAYNLPADSLHGTDMANAALFRHLFGEDVRYHPQRNLWLTWTGSHWQTDDALALDRMAMLLPQILLLRASEMEAGKERSALRDLSKRLERVHVQRNMFAALRPSVVVTERDLNQDHYLLNCANGTLDLRTGKLRQHDRADLLTHCNGILYDPNAWSGPWTRFLNAIFLGKREVIDWVQRAVGYSATGSVIEQVFFLCYGSGANGKGTFLMMIRRVLGDLAWHGSAEMLLQSNFHRNSTDLTDLQGRRLVTFEETDQGRRFNEPLVKTLCGGDPVTARRLYENNISFLPTHKLWLSTNHLPIIRGRDHGIWRSIRQIPFLMKFTADSDPPKDESLPAILEQHLCGILQWVVEGCQLYQLHGLGNCQDVTAATAAYQAEMDVFSGWMQDCCTRGPDRQAQSSAAFHSFEKWCEANGAARETQRALQRYLEEEGFKKVRRNTAIFWNGFSMNDSYQEYNRDG